MTPSQTVAALSGTVPASAAPVPVTEEWFLLGLGTPKFETFRSHILSNQKREIQNLDRT
jgi:hypothetical protein